MVVLLTWLLVQPRYVKANSTQRIAIVLDSSASMAVFKDKLSDKLKTIIPELQGNAENAELWLLQSDASKSRMYHGKDLAGLLDAIDEWQPNTGAIEPSHSLRIARSLAGKEGAVVYLTDTPKESISYNAHLYSIGADRENVGFTGISFSTNGSQLIWKTLIRNYSNTPVTRTWYLENEKGQRTAEKSVTINARKIISLQGAFPKDSMTAKLVLSPDSFLLDDTLPLIRPIPKTLTIHSVENEQLAKLTESIRNSFPNISVTSNPAEADIQVVDSSSINGLKTDSIAFQQVKGTPAKYLTGNIVAEKHPLMEGLNWQALLVKAVPTLQHTETDEVLLWQGTRPLIFLRPLPNKKRCVIFNFDIQHSNLMKTEAAVVVLLRFFEQVREKKLSHQQLITETSQPLNLITPPISKESPLTIEIINLERDSDEETKTIRTYNRVTNLYAPDAPCFFVISHGGIPLLSAANYFADTREADFSTCATSYVPASTNATAVDRHTSEDHLWRYWIALALFAALASWYYCKPR